MKKITCIQQYVIDKLIDDEKMSIGSLIDAISKVCSDEQFNNILSILIETSIPCTNKEDLEGKINMLRMSMFIPKEVSSETRMQIIKVLREQFDVIGVRLKEARDYVDSCIGRYNIFPKAVMQAEIDKVIEKLEPYNVIVSTAGFY
nr:MAG: Ribosomal protein L7/L12 C-terminal domain [Bacteriophage sp.]